MLFFESVLTSVLGFRIILVCFLLKFESNKPKEKKRFSHYMKKKIIEISFSGHLFLSNAKYHRYVDSRVRTLFQEQISRTFPDLRLIFSGL